MTDCRLRWVHDIIMAGGWRRRTRPISDGRSGVTIHGHIHLKAALSFQYHRQIGDEVIGTSEFDIDAFAPSADLRTIGACILAEKSVRHNCRIKIEKQCATYLSRPVEYRRPAYM